jgi:hypothetical protein
MKNKTQRGAGHLVVILACLIIVGIFAIGWTVAKRQKPASTSTNTNAQTETSPEPASAPAADIRWGEAGGPGSAWQAVGGTPPKCPDPLLSASPVDTTKATSVLLPGQYRGTHFKAHGGFRYDNNVTNEVTVKLPMDARLTGLIRYYQTGIHSGQQELQYLVTFQNPCGIMIRFDHLADLSREFMKIAEKTPEPKLDDTRGQPLQDWPAFKAGTVVSTRVGAPNGSNTGLDIGIYDLRQPNEISKNAAWADLHRNESSQTFHGLCWLPLLPKADADRAQALLAQQPKSHKGASDYCTNAPGGSTLQYNGGKPVQ